MNTAAAVSITAAVFLLALGVTMWLTMGATIFAVMTEFGQLICG
ncbi:hypothetical protein [Acuticoccus yangtzensis]|nr:hypothetical protein [Acuticoccus yangtzensis]